MDLGFQPDRPDPGMHSPRLRVVSRVQHIERYSLTDALVQLCFRSFSNPPGIQQLAFDCFADDPYLLDSIHFRLPLPTAPGLGCSQNEKYYPGHWLGHVQCRPAYLRCGPDLADQGRCVSAVA